MILIKLKLNTRRFQWVAFATFVRVRFLSITRKQFGIQLDSLVELIVRDGKKGSQWTQKPVMRSVKCQKHLQSKKPPTSKCDTQEKHIPTHLIKS